MSGALCGIEGKKVIFTKLSEVQVQLISARVGTLPCPLKLVVRPCSVRLERSPTVTTVPHSSQQQRRRDSDSDSDSNNSTPLPIATAMLQQRRRDSNSSDALSIVEPSTATQA